MDLLEIITMILGALFSMWGVAKLWIKKIWKTIDEFEDVVSESAQLMKEVADVPAAFLNLAEIKDDGSVVFKPENWEKLKTEISEVTTKIDEWKVQLKEAIAAFKNLFKKEKK